MTRPMTEASDLTTLIERLEAAEVGNGELSALVMQSLVVPGGAVRQSPFNGAWCVYDGLRLWEQRGGWHRPEGWPTTTSLDAALALAERVLPGWGWCIRTDDTGQCFANVFPKCPNTDRIYFDVYAATHPLALCIAILKATDTGRE